MLTRSLIISLLSLCSVGYAKPSTEQSIDQFPAINIPQEFRATFHVHNQKEGENDLTDLNTYMSLLVSSRLNHVYKDIGLISTEDGSYLPPAEAYSSNYNAGRTFFFNSHNPDGDLCGTDDIQDTRAVSELLSDLFNPIKNKFTFRGVKHVPFSEFDNTEYNQLDKLDDNGNVSISYFYDLASRNVKYTVAFDKERTVYETVTFEATSFKITEFLI